MNIRHRKIVFIVFHRLQEYYLNHQLTNPNGYAYWYDRLYERYDKQSLKEINDDVELIGGKYDIERF